MTTNCKINEQAVIYSGHSKKTTPSWGRRNLKDYLVIDARSNGFNGRRSMFFFGIKLLILRKFKESDQKNSFHHCTYRYFNGYCLLRN
jgi:hypothetical protein